jgi:branched-chain amino acid transport system ATP-binding protein
MMLSVKNLCSGYIGIDALHDVSLLVPDRTIVAVLGANGAGKTALMRAISGLNRVRAGRVSFDDIELQRLAAADIVRRGVIHVPQGRALFGAMNVLENLELGAYLLADRHEREARRERVFDMFPILKTRAWQPVAYLSGGEQQMLAIGRALMSKPRLLLLDEPSLGLAPKIFDDILDKVRAIHAEGAAVLIAEQSVRKVLRMTDYCYVLANGSITLQGTGAELAKDHRIEKTYLGTTAHTS